MNASLERSQSLWTPFLPKVQAAAPGARALAASCDVDIVVVGAGIAGLSCAYELSRLGKSVLVLDRGAIGGGMSARTTAHLSAQFDDYYSAYVKLRGEEEARAYFESQHAAIARIETIQREEGIDCDFQRVDAYLCLAPESDPGLLDRELEACRLIGFNEVSFADPPVASLPRPALRFVNQARFHPLRYLEGLVRAIVARGGRIHPDTPVVGVEEMDGAVLVKTQSGLEVMADAAIIATNSPINDWIAIHTKQAPYRTYAIAAKAPAGAIPDALYWDTLDPYHYVRLQPGEDGQDWLIVGGEDHKTGQAHDHDARLMRLESWMRAHFPAAGAVEYRWSGQVMEPVDNVPFVGRNHGSANVFVVTGDSGEGITTGVVAGMIIAALALGDEHGWADAYRPQRATFRAAGEYVSENSTIAANMTEWVRPGDVADYADIAPGHGAVVRQGLKKVAAYRDEIGALHMRSAVCTHAGCIVHWNDFEKCWDCPCHGSQFGVDGEALNGPAFSPLDEP